MGLHVLCELGLKPETFILILLHANLCACDVVLMYCMYLCCFHISIQGYWYENIHGTVMTVFFHYFPNQCYKCL